MSTHLSQTQIAAYSERSLHPDVLLEIDNHLASCDTCYERLSRIRVPRVAKLDRPSSESREAPFHLDYQQHLLPYVEGTINDIDREIVDSHVELCSQCADDLKDLLAFEEAPVVALTRQARPTARWRQWLPQVPRPLPPVWTAAAAVLAVLIVPIAVFWWTAGPRPLDPVSSQNGKQTPEPASTSEPDASASQTPNGVAPPNLTLEPLLVLNDAGGQIKVDQSGKLEGLQDLPADLKESVERALATGQLRPSPALSGWINEASDLRGSLETKNTFEPLEPIDVVLETNRPTFRWQMLEAARDYTVTIYNSRLREVATSGPITGTEWTMPDSLERGVVYSWQVSASVDDKTVTSPKPPLPEARFRILDQRAASTLAKLKQSTSGNSHLAMGVFYWKHGLIAESEREFQALVKANPNSPVAGKLLTSIRALCRRKS